MHPLASFLPLSNALRQFFFDSKDSLSSLVNRDLRTTENLYWLMYSSRFSLGLSLDTNEKRIINFLSSFKMMTRSCNFNLVIFLKTVCVGRFFFFIWSQMVLSPFSRSEQNYLYMFSPMFLMASNSSTAFSGKTCFEKMLKTESVLSKVTS